MLRKRLLRFISLFILFPILFIIVLPLLIIGGIIKGVSHEIRNYLSMVTKAIKDEYK